MSPGFNLGDYVDVDARLRWFFERYPEGSLQSEVLVGPELEKAFVVVKAFAYRSSVDVLPGQGLAYEVFPGVTPYTKGSELMNAETSAWGRALAAIGAPTKGHVASADEVAGAVSRRQAGSTGGKPSTKEATPQAETKKRYTQAANRCTHTNGVDNEGRCVDCGKPGVAEAQAALEGAGWEGTPDA